MALPLPLATETRLGDTFQRRIAIHADMDATIPVERFQIPERVKIITAD